MFRIPLLNWKVDFEARSMFVTGHSWVFVTRVNKDIDGRWTEGKKQLPWFGAFSKKKVIKLREEENSVTERHQDITMVWIPYFCFYKARNVLDLTTKTETDIVV